MIYCIKGFYRFINKAPAKPCLSGHNLHLSVNDNKAYWELNPFLYPQKMEREIFTYNQ